jgi:hypothetical protein
VGAENGGHAKADLIFISGPTHIKQSRFEAARLAFYIISMRVSIYI